jgi:hypothetical protein
VRAVITDPAVARAILASIDRKGARDPPASTAIVA